MNIKDQKKENANTDDVVSINMPLSDILYARYRAKLLAAVDTEKTNQDTELTDSGIILLSKRTGENTYQMNTSSFGQYDDIITTLSFTLIRKLKENIKPDKKAMEDVLLSFMDFFIKIAKEEFFDDVDIDDDSIEEI